MLENQQIDHYQTFGFVVLRDLLDSSETSALTQELDRALRDGYGAQHDQREPIGDVDGHWLPMMSSRRTPVSLALVEDTRLLGLAGQLLGTSALPIPAVGSLLFGETGIHNDSATASKGVKFVAYLEPLTAATGALRFMPGSHHPDFDAAIAAWNDRHPVWDAEQLRRSVTGLPYHAVETRPGDVIAFDWQVWHASIGGADRRQWAVNYAADPGTAEEAARLTDFIESLLPNGDEAYDHRAYPCYDERWLVADPTQPERAALTTRMRGLGIFDLEVE